jgi:hypothetical protein
MFLGFCFFDQAARPLQHVLPELLCRGWADDFLQGQVPSGFTIHSLPSWYSDPETISPGVALDLVPRSAGLQFPSSHRHSSSTLLFTLTSLTLAPTNSLNLPDSARSMLSTADEFVKYLVPTRGIFTGFLG